MGIRSDSRPFSLPARPHFLIYPVQEMARACRKKLEELEERERKKKEKAEKVMNTL
jgi:hypothetical protein